MVPAVVDESSSSIGFTYQFVIIIATTIYIFIRLKLTKQKQTPPFKNIPYVRYLDELVFMFLYYKSNLFTSSYY